MMKSDPVITYNHMEEDNAKSKMKHSKLPRTNKLIYIAEIAIIVALIAVMFIVF